MPRTRATDIGEQKLLDDIQEFGWHCLNVAADDRHESFSYTVGLFQSYGHPELLIYGLPRNVAHAVLTIAADAARRGRPLDTAASTDELLEGYSCVFVPVPLAEYPEHVGFAPWYYSGDEFPVQQIVWPSKSGQFPWHASATEAFRSKQPILGLHARGV